MGFHCMYSAHVTGWISVGGSNAYMRIRVSVTADACLVYIIAEHSEALNLDSGSLPGVW